MENVNVEGTQGAPVIPTVQPVPPVDNGEDLLLEQIDAFREKATQLQQLIVQKERKAAELAVCKINIDSDIRLAMTGNIRKYFAEHPDHFDPRQYLKPARQAVKDMVAHKIQNVLGSVGKA